MRMRSMSRKTSIKKKAAREKIPQVAVLLESSHETSRGMLRGILRYVRINGPWALHLVPGGARDQRLPAADVNAVSESGRPLAGQPGIGAAKVEAGAVVVPIGSGTYRFAMPAPR